MTKLADKPGRQMSLDAIVDRERGRVQVLRNLHGTRGFLVDSGNMGWMPLAEWREFLAKASIQASDTPPSLFEQFTGKHRHETD